MPRNAQLVHRFQRRMEVQQSAKKAAAKDEERTKRQQVLAETSQALLPTTAYLDDHEAVPSTVSGGVVSDQATHVLQQHSPDAEAEETPTLAQLQIELDQEKDLSNSRQSELEGAEARIQELEQQLMDSKARLRESILEDQGEEIQKQRRVIKNLQGQLEEAESERDCLRKQFREKESTVWELESQIRWFQHCERLGEDQHGGADLSHVANDSVGAHQTHEETRARSKVTTKARPPMLGRRRGEWGLWVCS